MIVATVFIILQPIDSKAIWGGREQSHGYFDNDDINLGYNPGSWPSPGYVLPPDHSGISIPPSVDSIDTLISFLKDHYKQGQPTQSTVSYIVHSMLRVDGKDATRNVTVAEWTELENRLNGPGITVSWEASHSAHKNIVHQAKSKTSRTTSNNDVFWDDQGQVTTILNKAILIKHNGTAVYAFFRSCANPDGDLPGIPSPPKWELKPSAKVKYIKHANGTVTIPADPLNATAVQGDLITWNHKVTKTGEAIPENIVVKPEYKYQNNDALGGTIAGSRIYPRTEKSDNFDSGATPYNSASNPQEYLVGESDKGKSLCRSTLVKPSIWSDLYPAEFTKSSEACVTITDEPIYQPIECRPIVFTVTPRTYIYTYNGVEYTETIPVNVSTSLQKWGPYSIPDTIDATNLHTTGDPYTVTFLETKQHIESKQDINVDDPNQPIYGPEDPITGIKPIIGYEQVYSRTDIVMDGPESWTETIGPCYDYELKAQVEKINPDTREPAKGLEIKVNSSVVNGSHFKDGYYTKTRDTQWQLNQLIFQPGTTVPGPAPTILLPNNNSTSEPCPYFMSNSTADNCTNITNGRQIFPFNTTTQIPTAQVIIANDYEPGTKICFVLSVQPVAGWNKTDSDDRWNHSELSKAGNCVTIVKKPKVQIWGGDLLSKGLVKTSTSDKTINSVTNRFGSWTEYGIIAGGDISGAASGSAFANTGLSNVDPGQTNIACKYSNLSFTNTPLGNTNCTGTGIGYYTNIDQHNMPDVVSSFAGNGIDISGSVEPNELAKNTPDSIVDIYSAGDLILKASTLDSGRSIVIKSTGTVIIEGNQNYNPGRYSAISQIPQLVIIANKIIINNDVTNVDAWLIAKGNALDKGSIKTCADVAKDINTCKEQLIVNGPVMTDELYLYRTHGSEPGLDLSGEPAEIFNLRADAYLWAAGRALEDGRIQTVYLTELPPRL